MLQYDQEDRFHIRRHPRMSFYDYSQCGYYFITICTKDKRCIFGDPGVLNQFGLIAKQGLLDIETHFPEASVDKFVVMPNHVHAVIVLEGEGATLPVIVGQYKSAVSRLIHVQNPKMTVWQTSFHDHVIRNQSDYERIWSYIETNPMRWQDDCFYIDF